jgi:hypothetical protein
MKKTVFFGLLAIVLAFGLIGCDDDPSGSKTVEYKGTADGETYVLKITDDSTYELTVSGKTSKGTATKSGGTWILTPTSGEAFTVTINSSGGITRIDGKITFNDGTTKEGPGAVTPPVTPPPANAKSITITGLTGRTGDVWFYVFSDTALVAMGTGNISNNSVTALLEDKDEKSWTGSGYYYLNIDLDDGEWFFTNNRNWTNLSPGITESSAWAQVLTAMPKYNISSATTTISFNSFRKGLEWDDSWDGIEFWGGAAPTPIQDYVTSISAEYYGGTISLDTPLDDLRDDLTVTAFYYYSGERVLWNYELEGTLSVGTSTISVRYEDWSGSFTDTFEVSVSN